MAEARTKRIVMVIADKAPLVQTGRGRLFGEATPRQQCGGDEKGG